MPNSTPVIAWRALREGNERFVAGKPQHPSQGIERRASLAAAQTPNAVVFGCADSRVADRHEVASILLVAVRHFLPDAPIEIVEAERDGWRLRYGAYPVGGHQIWGATARVLGQLGAVLALH